MKNYYLFLLILFQISCTSNQVKEDVIIKKSNIISKTINVDGMTCVGCEVTLETEISKIYGIVKIKASSTFNNAIIEFDSTKTNLQSIVKIIKESGYYPKQIQ